VPWNVRLPKAEYYAHDDPRLEAIINEVLDQKVVAIDSETTGLTIWKDVPLFWSLAWGENRRVCLPAAALPKFTEVFDDPDKDWVYANAKYDKHMFANVGINIRGRSIDTQVMHGLLYEESPHGLDFMGQQLLGWQWKDMFEEWDKRAIPNVGDFIMWLWHNDPQKLIEYASNDAYGTLRIYHKLKKELEEAPIHSLYPDRYATLADLFFKTEVPFTRVLWKCERNGFLIDDEYLKSVEVSVKKELDDVTRELVKVCGRMINPDSPAQMRQYFIDELKLRPLAYTNGGKKGVRAAKVDYDFLKHYEKDVPAAGLMLKQRDLSKLLNTYVYGLPKWYDNHGRIHSKLNQNVARTGRLSSSDPNLQNIPNAELDVHKIRRAFIAERGKKLICRDYSALEMRLLACASMEQDMINIFLNGWDIHMGNASMVFGVPYEDLQAAKKKPKDQLTDYDKQCLKYRNAIKAIGFGLNYGMKEKLLANTLGCSVEEAIDLMERYMNRYPAVKKFYAEAIEETRRTGYAFSILGRRRFLPEIVAMNEYDRFRAERQAVNMQIQGSAADAAKMAMILIDEADLESRFGCKMLLQVHDELIFECPAETAEEANAEIAQWMEHPFPTDLAVPLTSEGSIADNWADAK